MQKEKRLLIETLTWRDVRDAVANKCGDLAKIIDDISPGKEFTVFKVRYPFGMKISDKNIFYLPNDLNASIPITDGEIDNNVRSKLTYCSLPLGIIIKNSVEVFFDVNRKVISLAVFGSDLALGVWEHFGWTTPYSITSGARSLYMLPKISETLSHKQLRKRFGVTESPPKHLYDHWQVFTQLANNNISPIDWFCEVIFFIVKLGGSNKKR